MQDRWDWIVGGLAALMGLLAGVWRGTLTSAKRDGRTDTKLTQHEQWLADLETRHREVERDYVTKNELHDMETRLLQALTDATGEWRTWREEERRELRALHQRLDQLRVPPSHGNGS